MASAIEIPIPIFGTIEQIEDQSTPLPEYVDNGDIDASRHFLLEYRHSKDTFHSYRRELEKHLQWVYLVAKKSLPKIDHQDIENYIRFCKSPYKSWISTKMSPKFIELPGDVFEANAEWRPFVVKVSKEQRMRGETPDKKKYRLSDSGEKATLNIIASLYSFLEMEDYIDRDPVKRARKKLDRQKQRDSRTKPIRRLTELQWDYVIETAETLADEDPKHERTLFIVSALYGMYLRISELTARENWTPQMNHFRKDADNNWWFDVLGKRNKIREISVSADMLKALKRYRKSLDLSVIPSTSDDSPLLPKFKGAGAMKSTRQIRDIVQFCFDKAEEQLRKDGQQEEADTLRSATVHWLRHTGISDDVKTRPREHVRDDAGHESAVTTERYIDVTLRERHSTAKDKKLRPID